MKEIKTGAFEGIDPEAYIDSTLWEDGGQGWWYATDLFSFIVEIFRLSHPRIFHTIEYLIKRFRDRLDDRPVTRDERKRAFARYLGNNPELLQHDLEQGKFIN